MKLKICGMTRQADLDLAAELGFDFCGFIFHDQSPRAITPEKAAGLRTGAMKRVGVFVSQGADEIIAIMKTARLDFAQLHGNQGEAAARRIGVDRVIRVFWPQRRGGIRELEQAAVKTAWMLLDAGATGGGSGRAQDWRSLGKICLSSPWFLAGGLNPENIDAALSLCRPDGIDLNSGLEDAPGVKNHKKMRDAVARARKFS